MWRAVSFYAVPGKNVRDGKPPKRGEVSISTMEFSDRYVVLPVTKQ
jgi:hypothetical protein